jgi:hypothetical protein
VGYTEIDPSIDLVCEHVPQRDSYHVDAADSAVVLSRGKVGLRSEHIASG